MTDRPNTVRSRRQQLTETTIAVLAGSGAALVLALVLGVRAVRARTRRKFDAMLRLVDDELGSISDSLGEAIERSNEIRADAVPERELAVDSLLAGASHWFERDELASVHVERGFHAVLDREIAGARTTRRPLSLVLLGVHDPDDSRAVERVSDELATLLGHVTRTTDTVVRRSHQEFGVLLPGTNVEGARRFHARLRAELEKSFDSTTTVSTGMAEWRTNETSKSFDARARSTVGRATEESIERRHADALDTPGSR